MRDSIRLAELNHLPRALDTEASLQGARTIVQAGVNDAAVMAGLMCRHRRLLLEHDDAKLWIALTQFFGRREPNNSCPDYGDVVNHSQSEYLGFHHETSLIKSQLER